jgi:hypothetical protein
MIEINTPTPLEDTTEADLDSVKQARLFHRVDLDFAPIIGPPGTRVAEAGPILGPHFDSEAAPVLQSEKGVENQDFLKVLVSEIKHLRKEINEIKNSNKKMDLHIDFIERIYEKLKYPIIYISSMFNNNSALGLHSPQLL